MNFGSGSPTGIQVLSPESFIPGKSKNSSSKSKGSNAKLNMRGFLDLPNSSKHKSLLSNKIVLSTNNNCQPIIIEGTKNLTIIEAFHQHNNHHQFSSNNIIHGHGQEDNMKKGYKNKIYGSNEDINEPCTIKNNYTRNGTELKVNNAANNNNNFLTISKSRVPDIQMINKYYGLIPKKFTMHSRHSADQNYRSLKSSGTKLRAKSAMTLTSTKKSSLDNPSDDPEYNDPLTTHTKSRRRGSSGFDNIKGADSESEIGDKSSSSLSSSSASNHIGLVTAKKMSVEKHTKKLWRDRRSSSLSILEGIKGGLGDDGGKNTTELNCHASKTNNKCGESSNKEAQRVIKIDLNNMSWEESYQSYSPSEELYSPLPPDNPKIGCIYQYNGDDMVVVDKPDKHYCTSSCNPNTITTTTTFVPSNNINVSEPTSVTCSNGPLLSLSFLSTPSTYLEEDDNGNGESCNSESHNNNNNHAHQSANQVEKESSFVSFSPNMQNANTQKTLQNNDDNGFNLDSKTARLSQPQNSQFQTSVANESSNGLGTLQESPNGSENTNSINANGKMETNSSSSGARRGRLRKTISFDEQLLRQGDTNCSGSYGTTGKINNSEANKSRRPMTANTRISPSVNNANVNQPPKVLPWTHSRSGQTMSLAERRAKLQKSFSIHSSDSFDFGDGEASDIETDSTATLYSTKSSIILPGPNSSAYKETRKPLFFQQPPEVSTMVSQINPIDNLEIQCEIEKVAVMLKNMQNQNKSFIDLSPAATATSNTNTFKKSSSPSPGVSTLLKADTITCSNNDNEFSKDAQDINGNPAGNTINIYSASTANINTCNFEKPIPTVEDVGVAKTKTSMGILSPPGLLIEGPDKKNVAGYDYNNLLKEKDSFNTKKKVQPAEISNKPQCTVATSLVEDIIDVGIGKMDKTLIDSNSINTCITNPTGVLTGVKDDYNDDSTNHKDTISLKVQSQPSPIPGKRPPFKKSVSISCEKELFDTSGASSAICQNEVNGNGHESNFIVNGNKGSRPKTASGTGGVSAGTSKPFLRTSSLTIENSSQRTRSIVSNSANNHHHHQRSIPSEKGLGVSGPKSIPPNEISSSNQSQALRNRKILIKKALIEINQSAAQLGKKWGTLGRPKTAPNNNSFNSQNGNGGNDGGGSNRPRKPSTTGVMACGQNQKRQPLKASPQTLHPQSSSGVKPGNPVGKAVNPNPQTGRKGESGKFTSESEGSQKDQENMVESSPGSGGESSGGGSGLNSNGGNRRTLHRQSFSLDEGMLLGFSNKEFGWNSLLSETNGDTSAKSQSDLSFLSSTKREECLKIYEKMMKTGLAVKLDTIFRGMMTPSEYRAFIKAAENAAREAAEAAAAAEEAKEEDISAVDAGVSSPPTAVASETSKVIT